MQTLGEEAASSGLGVSEFVERHRDTHDFARRTGRLPEQRAGDRVDYRPLLHRDGSVLSAVTLEVRTGCSCALCAKDQGHGWGDRMRRAFAWFVTKAAATTFAMQDLRLCDLICQPLGC